MIKGRVDQGFSASQSLTWIPGHTGIEYNEKADQLAKSALARQPDRQTETLTYLACKSLILRKINKRWQEKWDRLTTGRATHERLVTHSWKEASVSSEEMSCH